MKKIFLYTYAHCNLGDDLFVKTICERYPQVTFYMECKPEFSNSFDDIKNLQLLKKNFFYKVGNSIQKLFWRGNGLVDFIIKKCDATIILGGSMFIQNSEEKWRQKAHQLEKLKIKSKSFFVIGANFGPYTTNNFLDSYKNFFAKLDDVCFRDRKSTLLFKNLPNVRLGSDVVFDVNFPIKEAKRKKLTIIPISLHNRDNLKNIEERYLEKLIEVIRLADKKGYDVTLHSFCKDQGDQIVIDRILSRLKPDLRKKITRINYHGNITESLESIAESSLVLTTRFHGMILGWLSGCKVTPISYDLKMDNLLDDLNLSYLGCKVKDIDCLDSELIFSNREKGVSLSEIRKLYESPFKVLDNFIDS